MYKVTFESLDVLNRVITCLETCRCEKGNLFAKCEEANDKFGMVMLSKQIVEISSAIDSCYDGEMV